MEADDHRRLGISRFNRVRELLEQGERTAVEVDEMIGAAHASHYHWSRAASGVNLARGDWQCSRVYAALRRGEPALWHARRCLDLTEAADDAEDWDLPFAYEALARAHAAAGHHEEAARFRDLAEQAGATIADPEDREHLREALADL
jgi:hypothetical protein